METGVEFLAADSPDDEPFILHIKASFAEEEMRKITSAPRTPSKPTETASTSPGGSSFSIPMACRPKSSRPPRASWGGSPAPVPK